MAEGSDDDGGKEKVKRSRKAVAAKKTEADTATAPAPAAATAPVPKAAASRMDVTRYVQKDFLQQYAATCRLRLGNPKVSALVRAFSSTLARFPTFLLSGPLILAFFFLGCRNSSSALPARR